MKIAIVNSFYDPEIGGGAEVTLRTLAQGYARRGHEVTVFCQTEARSIRRELRDGVNVVRLPSSNLYYKLSGQRPPKPLRVAWNLVDTFFNPTGDAAAEAIAALRPDVIAFHNLSGLSTRAWRAAERLGVPGVQVLHDLYLLCPPTTMMRRGQACARQCGGCHAFRRRTPEESRKLAAVVGVSRFILDRFRAHGYFEGIEQRVIHNGRPIARVATEPVRPSGRPLVFGYIGGLTAAKGLDWLLSAFPATDGVELLVAGAGDPKDLERFRALAAGKRVRFLGYTAPADFFPQIDVAITPSIWPDTFPGVIIEACAYHRPVIGSDMGGVPEILQPEVNGLLCDPADPASLTRAIERCLADPALVARLSAGARASVAPLLDADRMVDSYLQLFTELTARRAPAGPSRQAELAP